MNKESINSDSYELVKDWPNLPDHFNLGNPIGLGVDTLGNVYVFHRAGREFNSPPPLPEYPPITDKTIMKIDRNSGELLDSWGDNLFIMPHGLTVDSENNIWVTDVGLHQIFKFDQEGKLLMTLGEAEVSGNDSTHFNLPTDVAVASDGSFYISDGYRNSRVVKYSSEGRYLFEWGNLGNNKSEFEIPHGIDLDKDGNVYVADRENNRIQKFDSKGYFLIQWKNKISEQLYSVTVDEIGNQLFAVDFMKASETSVNGSNIFRFDLDANLQLQFGRTVSNDESTAKYHDIAVDNEGNIYVGDIIGNQILKFRMKKND